MVEPVYTVFVAAGLIVMVLIGYLVKVIKRGISSHIGGALCLMLIVFCLTYLSMAQPFWMIDIWHRLQTYVSIDLVIR